MRGRFTSAPHSRAPATAPRTHYSTGKLITFSVEQCFSQFELSTNQVHSDTTDLSTLSIKRRSLKNITVSNVSTATFGTGASALSSKSMTPDDVADTAWI